MLNLRYMDDLPARFGVENHRWEPLYPFIEDHELAAFLRRRGYRYVFFPSAFPPTRRSRIADLQIPNPSEISPEFEIVWLRTTAVPTLHEGACRVLGCQFNRFPYVPETADLLDWKFARIPELADGPAPVFAFVHLTLPHEPYVYDRQCRHREPSWPLGDFIDTVALKGSYVAQIECLNRKLLLLVDEIILRSRIPPVILIQSDHGHGRLGGTAMGLEQTAPWQVTERISLFAAYLLPGVPRVALWDSITPVNTTRLLLREYFDADLPPLPDATYWSAWTRPYRYTRIK
jgi:hypothetical protein